MITSINVLSVIVHITKWSYVWGLKRGLYNYNIKYYIFIVYSAPIICYKYNKPIRPTIIKVNKIVTDIDIDTNTPDS